MSLSQGEVPNKSAWTHGQVDVAAAGTAEQLPDVTIPDGFYISIIAKPGNTDTIYLGKSKADAESATDRFDGLAAGLAHALRVTNANLVWVDAAEDGEGISWSVEQ